MRILLVTAPFCQLNSPYPATAFLTAWLKAGGHKLRQVDSGLEVFLKLFSSRGLENHVFTHQTSQIAGCDKADDGLKRCWNLRHRYIECADIVLSYLQGKDGTLASLLCRPGYLPEGEGLSRIPDDLFGQYDLADRARLRATAFLEDLADFIAHALDPDFAFSRYGERLALSPPSFDDLYNRMSQGDSPVSRIHWDILDEIIREFQPEMAGFSVPFPGTLLETLRAAAAVKKAYPDIHTTLGGGYVNTELRRVQDIRLSECFDSVTLDDGEDAMEALAEYLQSGKQPSGKKGLVRTFLPEKGKWIFHDRGGRIHHRERPAPDYDGLPLNAYLSLADRENPMHRLWSEGPWIKMMLAHGCYWKLCAFCDTSLDYIQRFEPSSASQIADQMEELTGKTGKRSFHFVDEAAPPGLLKNLSLELMRRKLSVSWWTNIRFERNFTPGLCRLLARAGCIAVSGGLETASDRLLEKMNKGITVLQAGQTAAAFRKAGLMVHAYLMYGFPGQSARELVNSLETVRQLFARDLLQSAYWHHFALTAHSPAGLDPQQYGIRITGPRFRGFAENDLQFQQESENLAPWGEGLKRALYNYMRGEGMDLPLQSWFSFKIPPPSGESDKIAGILDSPQELEIHDASRFLWIESLPEDAGQGLIFRGTDYQESLALETGEKQFVMALLEHCLPEAEAFHTGDFDRLAQSWNINGDDFISSSLFADLMDFGLLIL